MLLSNVDVEYQGLLDALLASGERIKTRNAPVRRLFDYRHIELFSTPLVTVRKCAWKNALREWEWFMNGSSNTKLLHPSVLPWWSPWQDKDGFVSNNYGEQFRHFHGRNGSVDQINLLIRGILEHPYSRRNVITTWNTSDMVHPETPITNCHNTVTQAFVDSQGRLSLKTYQRSVDVICGLPHNWIQMWAFLLWLCHLTKTKPGSLIWIGGDVHLYDEHEALAKRIVEVSEKLSEPTLIYTPTSDSFKADDFTLSDPYVACINEKARMIV